MEKSFIPQALLDEYTPGALYTWLVGQYQSCQGMGWEPNGELPEFSTLTDADFEKLAQASYDDTQNRLGVDYDWGEAEYDSLAVDGYKLALGAINLTADFDSNEEENDTDNESE